MQMSTDLISRRQQVQILRQLPITRARMVRGIVANEARDGSTPFARSNSPRPMDPVDGLLSRRRWFESNSGRHHSLADGAEQRFLNAAVRVRLAPREPRQYPNRQRVRS